MRRSTTEYSLAELMVCAGAEAFRHDGEVLASGTGVLPRLAASLAMRTVNRDLMMTDSEAWLLSEPNPVSGRKADVIQQRETWMGVSRIFDNICSGKRHSMAGASQIDRFGQANISALGRRYEKPDVQMLGVRGYPANSISHANSFFVPSHTKKVFVEGECDVVASIGYNPSRLPRGYELEEIDLRVMISDLCVMDWGGPNHQMRLLSLHPGISLSMVLANTSFEVFVPEKIPATVPPSSEQLAIIGELDPGGWRNDQIKDNPPGDRRFTGFPQQQVNHR